MQIMHSALDHERLAQRSSVGRLLSVAWLRVPRRECVRGQGCRADCPGCRCEAGWEEWRSAIVWRVDCCAVRRV